MNVDTQISPGSTWQPLTGPFTRWPRTADAILSITVFLVMVFVMFIEPDDEPTLRTLNDVPIGEILIAAMASSALYWRRSYSLAVLGLSVVATGLSTIFGYSELIGISMMVALYSVGRYFSDEHWSHYIVGGMLVLTTMNSFINNEPAGSIGSGLVIVFLTWYTGRRFRNRGDYLRLLQERADRLEQDQEDAARRAVAEERTRIARELHDVVAHQVSLMTVQAGAAKTVITDNPQGALQAMEAVEKAGRSALDELRHLLGVLRPKSETEQLSPQRGLVEIPRLVQSIKEAGLDVSLTLDNANAKLPVRIDLSTYRIVQEALTNVLKHAGSEASADVDIDVNKNEVIIQVLDNGDATSIEAGTGHGIAGMRERVQLLGGNFDAGPRPGGGFQVVARLPIEEAR